MGTTIVSALFAATLFAGMLACLRLGWRLGRRRLASLGENGQAGLGTVEGAVFGLMGLLIAFTFTSAATRFYDRRDIMIQQVNAIGTAWLRLDLLNDSSRSELRELFRRYVDTQLEVVANVSDQDATADALARLAALQGQIWTMVMSAVETDKSQPLAQVLLPPINDMFDLATTRFLATRQHPPMAVIVMLGLLILVSAVMAGFGMAKARHQSPLHLFGFATIMALSIYLILDLEYPRLGLMRIDSFDQALVELRSTMR